MSEDTERGVQVCIDVRPAADSKRFRIAAADEILRLLADAHESEFSIPDLVDATGAARSTVWRAVDLLEDTGAIRVRETPQRNYVSIVPDRLRKDDPVLGIEQSVFHDPVRAFVDRIHEAIDETDEVADIVGIVVFGSVARGEADRQSDIDLFVVVDGDRTSARRVIADVVGDLEERRFDGDRFAFEPYVESVESALRAGGKLHDIFAEGITIERSDRLQTIRTEALADE